MTDRSTASGAASAPTDIPVPSRADAAPARDDEFQDAGDAGPDRSVVGDDDGAAAAAPSSSRLADAVHTAGAALRTHWFFALVFALGVIGRLLTMVAYQPALLYIDSFRYLRNMGPLNPTGTDPAGYPLVLRLLLDVGDLTLVVAVQHGLMLAVAVCIYILLLRHRISRTLAVLATAPVLLDAYEWQIEQNILTDSLFLAMVATALVLLTWRRRPGAWLAASAGLVLGLAVTIRLVGETEVVFAALFVVLATGPAWRRRLKVSAAFVAACAVPLVSYAAYEHGFTGKFGIQASSTGMLYGRTATIADCASLPADLKPLCPPGSVSARQYLGPDHFASAPKLSAQPLAKQFSSYVVEHQPLQFAEAVGRDFLELFTAPHDTVIGGTAVSRWQFQTQYPEFAPVEAGPELASLGQPAPAVNTGLAQLLRDYQLDGGYTPDVLFAVFALAGLGGALGLTRGARRSGMRAWCALWTGTGVVLLLAADVFEFSWRYQLIALVTLPVGGAFGIAALLGRGRLPAPPGVGIEDEAVVGNKTVVADEEVAGHEETRLETGENSAASA